MKNLSKIGKVEYIWECQWSKQRSQFLQIPTEIERILFSTDNEKDLLDGILNGSLFGFAVVSVQCPQKLIDEYQRNGFLWPPIIRKMCVTEDMLSSYMREQYEIEGVKCTEPTLCQTYSGEDLLLFTPLIRFYADKGYKIYNIKRFTQYVPGRVFAPFVKKGNYQVFLKIVKKFSVYDMRVAATKEGDEAKATTSKLFGNSSYGKVRFYIRLLINSS